MVLERRRVGNTEVLTLNRPEQRNALSPELIAALSAALAEVLDDAEARVVVLTGAGDRAFCAGMDLKAFAGGGSDQYGRPGTEAFDLFINGQYPKPIIGAANGTAVAGGFELLLSCDLVVASDRAKFGLPEVKRGLFAAGGGTTLPGRIPLALALEYGLTGDLFDAARALQLGLVNAVVAPQSVVDAAIELADRIAANGPLAVAATKKLMRMTHDVGVAASREAQTADQKHVFSSADAREGAQAFTERREPRWTGR